MSALTGGRYFERLLTRFSVPEELFGPLSLAALEEGKYIREVRPSAVPRAAACCRHLAHTPDPPPSSSLTHTHTRAQMQQVDGYLPTAECAFVDEVFKANSAILNALLTILNERLFDNGAERKKVPLLCLVGASNEMPESEELDALYDRFLLRRSVRPLSQAGVRKLAALAAGGGTDGTTFDHTARPIGMDELRACRAAATKAVRLPDAVVDLLCDLRSHLSDKCEPPVYVSDRRFGKCVTLLQVAAHANGAPEITEYDCLLLEFVLGQRPGDSDKVRAFVLDAIASDAGLLRAELAFLGVFGRAARALRAGTPDAEELGGLRAEVADLVELLSARWRTLGATLDGEFPLLRANVWMGPAAVASATQVIAPVMRDNRAKVETLLREVLLLQAVVASDADCGGVLESLLPRRIKQYEKGISQ
jgi:MoxR-like ATPase